nr:MAG TPA: hypothetical protein [Caudoviricetes sp.]
MNKKGDSLIMKTIEITLNVEEGRYSILENFKNNTGQGLNTNDIEEAKEYITNILKEL